jgi:membrane protein involved in colicin uptake
MSQNEEKFYELAHEELEDNPNKGLLVKLGIECDDDKKKIRIRYIETRVEQFKEAEARKEAEAKRRIEEAEEAEAKKKVEEAEAKKKKKAEERAAWDRITKEAEWRSARDRELKYKREYEREEQYKKKLKIFWISAVFFLLGLLLLVQALNN